MSGMTCLAMTRTVEGRATRGETTNPGSKTKQHMMQQIAVLPKKIIKMIIFSSSLGIITLILGSTMTTKRLWLLIIGGSKFHIYTFNDFITRVAICILPNSNKIKRYLYRLHLDNVPSVLKSQWWNCREFQQSVLHGHTTWFVNFYRSALSSSASPTILPSFWLAPFR